MCLLLGILLLDSSDTLPLLGQASSTTFPDSLVLETTSLHLVGENLGSGLLGLSLVNVFHEHTLVLEDVTLGLLVEDMVEVLIDFSGLSILSQQPSEDSLPSHPLDLGGETSVGGTLSLTGTSVATFSLGGKVGTSACAGVDNSGFNDNSAVLDEFLHVCSRVGVADFSLLSRVKPDFSLAGARDSGGEALL